MIVALVAGLVVPSWFALRHEKAEVQASIYADMLIERDRYADILERTIGSNQTKAYIEGVITLLMLDSKVKSVTVTTPEGAPIASASRDVAPEIPVLATTRTVAGLHGDVATFSIELSVENIYLRLRDAEKRFYTRTGWTLAATLTLLSLAFYIGLMRPVERLVRQANDIARNKLDEEIVWNRNDEIGRVGKSLENTRQALASLIGSLQQANRELAAENEKRRIAEASVAAYANQLEIRVDERTRELSEANTQLARAMDTLQLTLGELVESEKMASLGRLVVGVAHELNTPLGNALTVATGFQADVETLSHSIRAGAIKRSALEGFMARSDEGAALLVASIRRAAALVQSFKQLAADQKSELRRNFGLEEVFADVRHQVMDALRQAGVRLTITVDEPIELDSYPEPLNNIVTCLVRNAITHAFSGSTGADIQLNARRAAGHAIEILCTDNGCGIPADSLARVFDPFFTSRLGTGSSGLGLSIVHTLVTHVLGGRITATSTVGSGTTFTVHLPVKAPDLTARHPRPT